VPITTIKNAKRLLAAALSVLMICQTAVAVDHRSNYELGLEKASNGKYDIAIRYFKKVAESDPHYADARIQLQSAEEKQEEAREASNTQTQINEDTDRCRNLFEIDRSPDAFDCVEHVRKLQERASEEFGGKEFKSPALENLKTQMTPYARVDELAERVKGIAMDANGMDSAQEDLDLLESVLYTKEYPEDAKTMAAVVLTHTYKGATMAFKTSCEIAREGTDQQAADKICGRHEESLNKYTFIKTFLDQSVKLLGNKQVPSKLYPNYKPIGDKAAALPNPKDLALTEKNVSIPAGSAGANAEGSWPSWAPYAAAATAVIVILATVCWFRKPAPAKKPVFQQPAQQTHTAQQQPTVPTIATNPVMQTQSQAATTSGNGISYELRRVTDDVNTWLNKNEAVAKGSDSSFARVRDECAKYGIKVDRTGHQNHPQLIATPSADCVINSDTVEMMRIVNAARKSVTSKK